MFINKDIKMIQEAYISSNQKITNVPPRVNAKQPDDTEAAVTYEDRMQQSGEVKDSAKVLSTTNTDKEEKDQSAQSGLTHTGVMLAISIPENKDEQIEMDKTNLFSLYTSVKRIYEIVSAGHVLDVWMSQKVAICADGLSNVQRVVEYDHHNSTPSSINPSVSK